MPRRFRGTMSGERFLGDLDKLEVHDLGHETEECDIDKNIHTERETPFRSVSEARSRGYAHCGYCMPDGEV